jgi:AcrR family transcriptional regulator
MRAGRKRAFDKSDALDRAMRVFWENGYNGTSVNDLTEALGINKPSLYAAFGNKEQLFETALNHYASHYGAPLFKRLTEPAETPFDKRVRCYMTGIIDLINSKESPKGCMFVKSCCEAGSSAIPAELAPFLTELSQSNEKRLIRAISVEQKRGQLLQSVKPREIADYLFSVLYGLTVLAKQGKSRNELIRIVDMAINALPMTEN